jgi:hypothetical protein
MRTWSEKPKAENPVCVPAREPPTSKFDTIIPGDWPMTVQMSRAFGIELSISWVTLV